jgi:hypothetical protein
MQGVLVAGSNHFIVRGPLPGRDTARALVRHWSLIQIGGRTPQDLAPWSIISKAYREDLEWAVLAPGEGEISPAAAELLAGLSARGIVIEDSR